MISVIEAKKKKKKLVEISHVNAKDTRKEINKKKLSQKCRSLKTLRLKCIS